MTIKEKARKIVPNSTTGTILFCAMLCALIVFWPAASSQQYWHRVTWHVTQEEMIPVEQVKERSEAILHQANKAFTEGSLTVEKLVEFQGQLAWLSKHSEPYGPHPRRGAYFNDMDMSGKLAGIRSDFLRGPKHFDVNWSKVLESNATWKSAAEFRPSTEESNAPQVVMRYVIRYVLSLPVAFVMLLVLLVKNERGLGQAIVEAFSLRAKLFCYPFTVPFHLLFGIDYNPDYRRQAKRFVNFVVSATAASVSLFCGGAAFAQVVKKENKKKSSPYTLQLDNRVLDPIGAPPTEFNRTTFNSHRWVFESISTITSLKSQPNWYNESGGGLKIVSDKQAVFSINGYVANASAGVRKLLLGAQYFRSSPRVVIAVPVMRFEKTVRGKTALNFVGNPIFKLAREGLRSRLAISPDLSFKKVFGGPQTWAAGLGFDVFPRKGKGDRMEMAVLHNSAGQNQVRGRYVLNFAF